MVAMFGVKTNKIKLIKFKAVKEEAYTLKQWLITPLQERRNSTTMQIQASQKVKWANIGCLSAVVIIHTIYSVKRIIYVKYYNKDAALNQK